MLNEVRCLARRIVLVAGLLLVAETARADGSVREVCRQAYEQGQETRARGQLHAALEQFRTCSKDSCAPFMRSECTQWIDEVSAAMPSLVIVARTTKGNDVADARLYIDGQLRAERLGGVPFEVDPGEHVLRVEAAGSPPNHLHVVVRTGEKERRVELTLAHSDAPDVPSPKATPSVTPPADASRRATPPADASRRPPLAAYVLTGIAVAGVGVFTTFAALGKSIENDRAHTCSPTCSDAQLAPMWTDYRVADVGLGVGILAAVGAVYFFLQHER